MKRPTRGTRQHGFHAIRHLDDFRSLDEMRVAAEQAKRLPAREPAFPLAVSQSADRCRVALSSMQLIGAPALPKLIMAALSWRALLSRT